MEKAVLYGKLGIPQEANFRGEPEIPDDVAKIDSAIARLCEIDKRAIIAYYTHWEAMETIAKRCGMRVRQFQNVLRRARWRLTINMGGENLNVTQWLG
jgi:DNA-directed RNA polymerase specialized sigma24 family protein